MLCTAQLSARSAFVPGLRALTLLLAPFAVQRLLCARMTPLGTSAETASRSVIAPVGLPILTRAPLASPAPAPRRDARRPPPRRAASGSWGRCRSCCSSAISMPARAGAARRPRAAPRRRRRARAAGRHRRRLCRSARSCPRACDSRGARIARPARPGSRSCRLQPASRRSGRALPGREAWRSCSASVSNSSGSVKPMAVARRRKISWLGSASPSGGTAFTCAEMLALK